MLALCIDTSGAIYRPPALCDFIHVINRSYFSSAVQNNGLWTANNCAHLLEHLCVAHVLCIDTSGAIYRPPVCLHTTVKKAIIDCAASSANIQSGKHNILHIPSQPQMSICPSPKFSCYKSFRRCLKLDLGYGSPLPCTYTAAVL